MAQANDTAPIIKRIKKVSGHAHHGGAWKVAYADFVTAMMAFFLLLWLLNATTEDQKRAISNYFAPTSVSNSTSGSGGVMGGKSFSEDGALPSMGGSPAVMIGMPPPVYGDQDAEEPDDDAQPGFPRPGEAANRAEVEDLSERELEKAAARAEEMQFERTAEALRDAMESSPELIQLADSLIIDQTAEGLRIQLVDQDKLAMFPIGSSKMDPRARSLLQQIADAVGRLPNKISLSGHTDATPYLTDRGYSNWELSSDRANASRRVLMELGIHEDRITRVVGRADTEPLVPDDVSSPRNRRISITLLREAKT